MGERFNNVLFIYVDKNEKVVCNMMYKVKNVALDSLSDIGGYFMEGQIGQMALVGVVALFILIR